MLRLVLPVLLLLLGLAGGVGAGLFLGPAQTGTEPETETAASETPASEATGSETEPAAATEPATPAPGESVAATSGQTEFVRLNNQFVVPIVQDGSVRSLVVMALALEVDLGQNSAVFDREPRLRDAFLQVLFAHANAGGFDGSFTQASAMDPLREALNEAAARILGPLARDVLIMDITRQDA
jgi:hypothetical protein